MTTPTDDVYLGAGKLIVFSTGSYSDYGYRGMYVTLQPLLRTRLREIAEDTEGEHNVLDRAEDEWFSKPPAERVGEYQHVPGVAELFQTNLIKAGLLMIVDYQELHMGDYSSLELTL